MTDLRQSSCKQIDFWYIRQVNTYRCKECVHTNVKTMLWLNLSCFSMIIILSSKDQCFSIVSKTIAKLPAFKQMYSRVNTEYGAKLRETVHAFSIFSLLSKYIVCEFDCIDF